MKNEKTSKTPRTDREIQRLQSFAKEIRASGFKVHIPSDAPLNKHALTLERLKAVIDSAVLDEISETIFRLQALAEYSQDLPEGDPLSPLPPAPRKPSRLPENILPPIIRELPINREKALDYLLGEKYRAGWRVIDGVNQDPDGLNFIDWLKRNNLIDI